MTHTHEAWVEEIAGPKVEAAIQVLEAALAYDAHARACGVNRTTSCDYAAIRTVLAALAKARQIASLSGFEEQGSAVDETTDAPRFAAATATTQTSGKED